jgi:hypothetical protein
LDSYPQKGIASIFQVFDNNGDSENVRLYITWHNICIITITNIWEIFTGWMSYRGIKNIDIKG